MRYAPDWPSLTSAADADLVVALFNKGWSESWGFTPMRRSEFTSLSKLLKPLVTDQFAFFILLDGRPVGFAIVIPNLHELTCDLGGRVVPLGLIRLLWRIRKSRFHSARLDMLGLQRAFHGTATGGAIVIEAITELITRAKAAGISHVELGWILEDNAAMHRIVRWSGGQPDKVHRIYEKLLA